MNDIISDIAKQAKESADKQLEAAPKKPEPRGPFDEIKKALPPDSLDAKLIMRYKPPRFAVNDLIDMRGWNFGVSKIDGPKMELSLICPTMALVKEFKKEKKSGRMKDFIKKVQEEEAKHKALEVESVQSETSVE